MILGLNENMEILDKNKMEVCNNVFTISQDGKYYLFGGKSYENDRDLIGFEITEKEYNNLTSKSQIFDLYEEKYYAQFNLMF